MKDFKVKFCDWKRLQYLAAKKRQKIRSQKYYKISSCVCMSSRFDHDQIIHDLCLHWIWPVSVWLGLDDRISGLLTSVKEVSFFFHIQRIDEPILASNQINGWQDHWLSRKHTKMELVRFLYNRLQYESQEER